MNARTLPADDRRQGARTVRAPRGTQRSAKSWLTEAPLRMLMNNLDPEVAENPDELVVYGGIGRAARNWECFDRIVETLRALNADETLLIQSGKPVGVFRTHEDAPRVLLANSNLVPKWSTWDDLLPFSVTPAESVISTAAWHTLANAAATPALKSTIKTAVVAVHLPRRVTIDLPLFVPAYRLLCLRRQMTTEIVED